MRAIFSPQGCANELPAILHGPPLHHQNFSMRITFRSREITADPMNSSSYTETEVSDDTL